MNYFLNKCMDELGESAKVLPSDETTIISDVFECIFPIAWWGRIDWEKMTSKKLVKSLEDLQENCSTYIFPEKIALIMWGEGSLPVIKAETQKIYTIFDDLRSVSFDTWVFFPRTFQVIEFYGSEIKVGIGTDIYDKLRECYEQFKALSLNKQDFSDEFGGVVSDIISVGGTILEIAGGLLENEPTSEKDLGFVEKKYMTKTAWNIKEGKVAPLYKESLVLNYAQALEELKELCRCTILYKKVIDIVSQPY